MQQPDFDSQIAALAALDEPIRRGLYLYVAGRRRDVSREEAARALRISRALAAFHLDKLVEQDLLETSYRRLSGRGGPGAGRPAKLYRRSGRQLQVSLPPSSYDLAARVFAQTFAGEDGPVTVAKLRLAARRFGDQLGQEARLRSGPRPSQARLLKRAQAVLRAYGFEPGPGPEKEIRLRNCPFDALARDYRTLVCGMNLSLMQGLIAGLGARGVRPELDPQPGMCCVAFRRARRS